MKHHHTASRFPLASLRILAASLLLAGVTACGGGGGDDSTTTSAKSFKGTVTAYNNPQSFSVDGIPVDASSSSTAPQGLATGSRVEVQGDMVNGTLRARRVELEDDHEGDDNGTESSELEGRVTSYTSPTSFSVDGIPVDASAAPTTLSVGVHVEVHGTVNNGVMLASRVKIEGSDSDDDEDDEKNDDGQDDDDHCDAVVKSSCPDEDGDGDGEEDDDGEDKDDDDRRKR
jgi:Domain of unknown function (DUF5666)